MRPGGSGGTDRAVRAHPDGATVTLQVVPRARRTAVTGRHGDAVKLKVSAPPVEGAANEEVRRFLGRLAGVRTSAVSILSGERSRTKVVLVEGADVTALRVALEGAGA